MKNLKISAKLILGFALVALIAAIIGGVGIFSLKSIDNSYSIAYTQQSEPLQYISKVIENLQRLRVDLRNYALYTGDATHLKTIDDTLSSDISAFESNLATYDATIVNPEARKLFDEAKATYNNSFKPTLLDMQQKSNNSVPTAELMLVLDNTTAVTNQMVQNFERCMEIKVAAGATNSDANTATANMVLVIMIVIVIVGIIVAMLLGVYISSIISKPVKYTKDILYKMGMKGIVNFSAAEYKQAEEYARFNDEVAESIKMLIATARRLETMGRSLETVAGGDLTADVSLLSESDTMGIALQAMLDNLNKMFSEINNASNQVSTGSVQIADGAQLLAQGATEQSATVEELSASVTEVSTQTKVNAGMAVDTKTLGEEIKKSAEKGNTQMNQMMQAVKEISDASQNISKVIKIIDDIAFQTNILALNAAVEAARAGQHGKGFAVVADEVRSLAAKSAEAAKNTGGLIASAVEKAELGARISQETSESLRQIVEGIMKSSELVSLIASSSEDQANAINQISVGIDQVSQVIQQNSATAEESAAASEEMSGQATLLQQLIAQFKLRGNKSSGSTPTVRPASNSGFTPRAAAPASISMQSTGYSISGDKY